MEIEKSVGNLHYLPIFLFIAIPATFISTYIIAVTSGQVEAVFPYISDTAASPPASCIFAQMINIAAALMTLLVYIRFSQVRELSSSYQLRSSLPKWNKCGLIIGFLTCLGLSMVANFQSTNVLVVHLLGASMCFGCGTAYFWVQVICSYYVHPLGCSLRIAHVRLCLALANTVFLIVLPVSAILAVHFYQGPDSLQWFKEDGGWEFHITSTIVEWMCAGSFCLYILTFTDEFRGIHLKRPKVVFKPGHMRTSNEVLNESQEDGVLSVKPPVTIT